MIPDSLISSAEMSNDCDHISSYFEEGKTRTRQKRVSTPGVSNNNTDNLMQKKILNPRDQNV